MKKSLALGTSSLLLLLITGTACWGVAPSHEIPSLELANFDAPQDNLYMPMAIGQTYVYVSEEDGNVVVDEITTTSETKEILRVATLVIHDIEWVYVEGI